MLQSFISYGYITDTKLNESLNEKNIVPIPIETVFLNSKSERNLSLVYKANLQQISTDTAVVKLRMKSETNYLNSQEIPTFSEMKTNSTKLKNFFSGFSSFSGFFDLTLTGIKSDRILTFALDLYQDDNPIPIDTKETSIFVKYLEEKING